MKSIGGNPALVDAMQAAIDTQKFERTEFDDLQQNVVGLLSVQGNTDCVKRIFELMKENIHYEENI